MMRIKTVLTTLAAVSALMLSGCGGERENDAATLSEGSLALALEQILDYGVIPAVNGFADQATELDDQVTTFCLDPDASGLSQLQSDWIELSLAWYQVLPFNFGPSDDDLILPAYLYIDSYRYRGINYVEQARTDLNSWVAGESDLNDAFFSALTYSHVGLLPLEVALYESLSGSPDSVDILADFQSEPRKCEALQGLSALMLDKASYIQTGWTESHLESGTPYRDLFLAGETDDGTEPLTLLLTTGQEFLDYLNNRNTVTYVASLSGQPWQMMTQSMNQLEGLLDGFSEELVSLFELMDSAGGGNEVATVSENLAMANEAIEDQDATSFNAAAALLDGNFKREIPDSLDVSLGINFSDGD